MSAGQVELSGEELDQFERLFPEIARYRARRRRDTGRARPDEPRPFPMSELEWAMGASSAHRRAAVLRVSLATLNRLRSTGLTVWQADVYACRAGLHPGLVWSEWWLDETNAAVTRLD